MIVLQIPTTVDGFEWTLIKGLGSAGLISIFACIGFLTRTLTALNATLQDFRLDVAKNYVSRPEFDRVVGNIHNLIDDRR